MDRVILHCDLNAFYASVELLDYPELQKQPVAVCGDPQARHGVILAKNQLAKAAGVQTAETVWQAKRKCLNLILLPAHHEKYARYSKLAGEIYERYTDLIEPFGIDESWLDLTGTLHLLGGDAKQAADEIRAVMKTELGLTLSVGVSFNKVFAKLGSDYRKPDATTVISRDNYRQIVWPLPVRDLLFVGKVAAQTLESHGIHTIGDLAHASREGLEGLLGKHGSQLYDYATGAEHSKVLPLWEQPPPKSVGNGFTFRRDLRGWEEIKTGVAYLADQVAMRLRRHELAATTLQVSIRSPDFQTISRQKRLACPTALYRDLMEQSMELIRQNWRVEKPIRALTITAAGLVGDEEGGEQLNLFQLDRVQQREKLSRLEDTVAALRSRYGKGAIGFASAPLPGEGNDGKD